MTCTKNSDGPYFCNPFLSQPRRLFLVTCDDSIRNRRRHFRSFFFLSFFFRICRAIQIFFFCNMFYLRCQHKPRPILSDRDTRGNDREHGCPLSAAQPEAEEWAEIIARENGHRISENGPAV